MRDVAKKARRKILKFLQTKSDFTPEQCEIIAESIAMATDLLEEEIVRALTEERPLDFDSG